MTYAPGDETTLNPSQRRVKVELFALVLILLGLLIVVGVGFILDWRMGLALIGASLVMVGLLLGYER